MAGKKGNRQDNISKFNLWQKSGNNSTLEVVCTPLSPPPLSLSLSLSL